jgi:hypothetical protein
MISIIRRQDSEHTAHPSNHRILRPVIPANDAQEQKRRISSLHPRERGDPAISASCLDEACMLGSAEEKQSPRSRE